MLQLTQDKRPEKSDDQGLEAISETIKIQPVGYNFTIKKGGSMTGNCTMCVTQHSSEINGGYCEESTYARALFFCRV